MYQPLTLLACFLATLMAGFGEVRMISVNPCATAESSCCCNGSVEVEPCICGDHSEADFPEMVVAAGLGNLVAPCGSELPILKMASLAHLAPSWHPALPWHAPPEERRSRLAIWIL